MKTSDIVKIISEYMNVEVRQMIREEIQLAFIDLAKSVPASPKVRIESKISKKPAVTITSSKKPIPQPKKALVSIKGPLGDVLNETANQVIRERQTGEGGVPDKSIDALMREAGIPDNVIPESNGFSGEETMMMSDEPETELSSMDMGAVDTVFNDFMTKINK
jgi:hypothetical protein